MDEIPLAGGNASDGVVRVGDTVRKPWGPETESVHAYMAALRASGVGVPAVLGRDPQGRQVLELVQGTLASDLGRLDRAQLRRAGALVRSIHEASAAFVPAPDAVWRTAIAPPGEDLVCHHDLAPWNLVIGERWVFIDWDAAAPSTRRWDLAYAAQAFALNDVTLPAPEAADDLAAFADGYRADAGLRAALPVAMQQRVAAMVALLEESRLDRREPWASMEADGHGEHWRAVHRYVVDGESAWREALSESR